MRQLTERLRRRLGGLAVSWQASTAGREHSRPATWSSSNQAFDQAQAAAEGIPVSALAELLFGPGAERELVAKMAEAAGGERVRDLQGLRRMLAVVDAHLTACPVLVRLGPADVEYAAVRTASLALDTADVAVSRTVQTGRYEPHLTSVFEDYCKPGMTVVDVGANIGYYTILAAGLVGPTGRVFAVEPSSENCRLLLVSIARNDLENVIVLPVAAMDRRGWEYFAGNLGSNGAVFRRDSQRLLDWPGTVVPAFPLDELVEGEVHFLKLDVEGVEPLVVEGAKRIVETYRPLVTSEFSAGMQAISCGRGGREYLQWFLDRGYRIVLLEREEGRRIPVDPEELVTSPDRLEDLLFLPE